MTGVAEDDEDDEDDDWGEDVSESRQKAKLLLESLPTNELLELERVANFLDEICKWAATYRSSLLHDHEICEYVCMVLYIAPLHNLIGPSESEFMHGPLTVWDAYETNVEFRFPSVGRRAVFNAQLSSVLTTRCVSDEDRESKLSKAILDVIHGSDDVCHRCNGTQGVHLWGRSSTSPLRSLAPTIT